MTDPSRSPGFKIRSVKPPPPLKMFFGRGDYVIAESAAAASCFWMEHFDGICYAKDFEAVPDVEEISIRIVHGFYGIEIAEAGTGSIQDAPAEHWVGQFGAGYLASTKAD